MSINKGYLTAKTDKSSDEVYTPREAIIPLLRHLDNFRYKNPQQPLDKSETVIWCPFDQEDSEYVKVLNEVGYKVIHSHIDNGQNFFFFEPDNYDVIISNPPFSIKDDIIKRLYELNKPYAMLFPLPTLQGQKRFPYMLDCQVLTFDKRINYYKDKNTKKIQKGISFASIYLCRKFLKRDLIFEKL